MSLIRASCPHCQASPRYGLEQHMQYCQKRSAAAPVSAVDVVDAIVATPTAEWNSPAEMLPKNVCPKCGKVLKKRGAHFHIAKCKGLS